ncbi:MAG: cytochrome c family protein [Pseudomonadota bacterium]
MLKKYLVIAVAAAVPALTLAPTMASAQDVAKGAKVFKKCKACHAVGEGAKNKVGPQLNGVVGRAAGSLEGYKYSKAMVEIGLTWDEATLDKYLANPKGVVKGTKMIYRGLKKEQQRKDIIAYLATYDAEGKKVEAAAAN